MAARCNPLGCLRSLQPKTLPLELHDSYSDLEGLQGAVTGPCTCCQLPWPNGPKPVMKASTNSFPSGNSKSAASCCSGALSLGMSSGLAGACEGCAPQKPEQKHYYLRLQYLIHKNIMICISYTCHMAEIYQVCMSDVWHIPRCATCWWYLCSRTSTKFWPPFIPDMYPMYTNIYTRYIWYMSCQKGGQNFVEVLEQRYLQHVAHLGIYQTYDVHILDIWTCYLIFQR